MRDERLEPEDERYRHIRDVTRWTAGALWALHRMGLTEHPPIKPTDRGISEFDQLDASGFRPSDEDLLRCLIALGFGPHPDLKALHELLIVYAHDRAEFEEVVASVEATTNEERRTKN